jgi:TetR/AcrR family transcriptional repressor of nem operon
MGRKLNKEEALSKAMDLFWRHGYAGTSMDMLTTTLGVQKPSIYAAFGNKHSLFLSALLHYGTDLVARVRHSLASAESPRIGIERVVRFMMTTLYLKRAKNGCFATNSALELADHDPEVAKHVVTMLRELRAALEDAITQAQRQGQVTATTPARVLANYLITAIEGVRITEKASPPKTELDALADFVLRALG